MSKGWIILHRKVQDSAIWVKEEPYDCRSAWIDLLLMANHEDREIVINGWPLMVHRGQKFTSIRKLSERWMWTRNKVARYLNTLEKLNSIQKSGTHNGTLITIVNYEFYQDMRATKRDTDEATGGTSVGHKRDTSEAQTTNVNTLTNENSLTNEKRGASLAPDPNWEAWE